MSCRLSVHDGRKKVFLAVVCGLMAEFPPGDEGANGRRTVIHQGAVAASTPS